MTAENQFYRPDIDGLRAVAVTSVLLFHAFPTAISGGFVGVDIFFVISGFLITSILIRESENNRFSIARFYVRRACRIFPALIMVLATVLVVGWLMLFPSEWVQLGKHLSAGSVFLSNIQLWRESGYFDTSSELKPLLHLWSLAVEEQYYLVWPMIIWMGSKRAKSGLLIGVITLALTSFLASIVFSPNHAAWSFFLPMARLWELIVGSGYAIFRFRQANHSKKWNPHSDKRLNDFLSITGLIFMVSAIVGFDHNTDFPGYAATFPVFGATMIIAAGPEALINRSLLSNPVLVWIGLISYPLYLWHWPLLAFSRIWFEGDLSPLWRSSALLLSILLAWLTFRWIEIPIRAPERSFKASHDAIKLWLALLTLGAIGAAIWTQLLPPRSAKSPLVTQITRAEQDWTYLQDNTWQGERPGRVLFVGDSHMQQYSPRIAMLMQARRNDAYSSTLITLGGCAPLPGITRRSVDCASFTQKAFEEMQAPDIVTVVLAGSWQGFAARPDYYRIGDPLRSPIKPLSESAQWVLDAWQVQLHKLVLSGKRVVVLLSSPRGPLVEPKNLIHRSFWSWADQSLSPRPQESLKVLVRDVDAKIESAAKAAGAEVIDPFGTYCAKELCRVVTEHGDPIFMDDSHVRASFVRNNVDILDRYLLDRSSSRAVDQ